MVKAIIALTLAIAAFASAAIGSPQGDEDRRLSQLMVGEWQSPRHTYLYRSDGTWTILPEKIDSYQATNGRWRTETAVLPTAMPLFEATPFRHEIYGLTLGGNMMH